MEESEIKAGQLLEPDTFSNNAQNVQNFKIKSDTIQRSDERHGTTVDQQICDDHHGTEKYQQRTEEVQMETEEDQTKTEEDQTKTEEDLTKTESNQHKTNKVLIMEDHQTTEIVPQENKENHMILNVDQIRIDDKQGQSDNDYSCNKTEEGTDNIILGQNEMVKLEDSMIDDSDLWWKYKPRLRRPVVKYEARDLTKKQKREHKKREQDMKRIIYEGGEKHYTCNSCDAWFTSNRSLVNHMRMQHKRQTLKYTCALCSEVFGTNPELIKHKIVHKDEQNFLCMKCQMAFTDHFLYLKHKLTHQNLENYKCLECGSNYNSKTGFLIHLETHYDTSSDCEICHRTFQSSQALARHMINHKTIGKYKCGECEKVCTDPKSLKYHMVTHTGVKLIQCLYCGKGFGNTQQRNVHTRIHTGEKPFECQICHGKFRQSTDMKRHMITHQTEKTVECKICKRKFFHVESLKNHMDIHNNTQRFECSTCGKRLHTHTSLRSHIIRSHTTEKNFHCTLCDSHFKTAGDLNKHNRSKIHLNNEYGSKKREKI